MTRLTTATLIAGPRTRNAWAGETWAIPIYAQLVEGGSSAYWLSTSVEPAEHPTTPEAVLIEAPDTLGTLDALLMVLAANLGDENLEGLLLDTHNIVLIDGRRKIAPFWEFSDDTRDQLAHRLSKQIRLGFTLLDEMCLVNDDLVSALNHYGFRVQVFTPTVPIARAT